MKRPAAKDFDVSRFLHAYLEARDEHRKSGEPVAIKGFPGWKVTKVKKEDFE